MKKTLIALVLLAVIGGGGYMAWIGSWDKGTGIGGARSFSTGEAKPEFVELRPITAPLRATDDKVQYLVLAITLQVHSKDLASQVHDRLPRLLDAFSQELYGLADARPVGQHSINLARVKARLLAGSERVLGPGIVDDVLVRMAR